MPLKLQIVSESGVQWVRWCKIKLNALTELRHKQGSKVLKKIYILPGNIIAEIISADVCDTIRISGGFTGVICHPRSGVIQSIPYTEYVSTPGFGSSPVVQSTLGVTGGWKDGKTLLNTQYVFPLDDTDNASFIITDNVEGVFDGYFAGSESLYGNLYWTNGEIDEDKIVVLSWKGTPTRHFRLPSNIEIPGSSILEGIIPGTIEDTPEYTSFGVILYQDGELYKESPKYNWPNGGPNQCLILGAMQDMAGITYIVAQSDRRNAPAEVAKPGFYITLWKDTLVDNDKVQVDGWELISEYFYGRNGLPWFGNQSGTEFVCGNGDKLSIDGTLIYKSAGVSAYAETMDGDEWGVTSSYVGSEFHEYSGDTLAKSDVAFSFASSESSSHTGKGSVNYTSNLPVLFTLDVALTLARVAWDETLGEPGQIICLDGNDYILDHKSFSEWDTTIGPTHWVSTYHEGDDSWLLSYFDYYDHCYTDRDILPYPYNDPELYPEGYCAPYNIDWVYVSTSPVEGCS
jgi:hypothetical protein